MPPETPPPQSFHPCPSSDAAAATCPGLDTGGKLLMGELMVPQRHVSAGAWRIVVFNRSCLSERQDEGKAMCQRRRQYVGRGGAQLTV